MDRETQDASPATAEETPAAATVAENAPSLAATVTDPNPPAPGECTCKTRGYCIGCFLHPQAY